MTSKEALVELVTEAKSLNSNDERLTFLREQIEKDLEILELIKEYTKGVLLWHIDNSVYNSYEPQCIETQQRLKIKKQNLLKIKEWLENEKDL